MDRFATAQWHGDIKSGKGELTTASNALKKVPYSFATRFENTPGTNPEELIAAAHAGCFTMALSGSISKAGFKPTTIETSAKVSIEKDGDGWRVSASHLTVQAVVSGLDQSVFLKYAKDAERNCPISKLLNAEITMDAKIVTNEKSFPTAAP